MKFKTDENLPVEIAELFRQAGYDAMSALEQNLGGETDQVISRICNQEDRILVTLDLDFSDIQTYPPNDFPGIIVLRGNRQDTPYLTTLVQQILPQLTQENIKHRLWIVEESRIRIREN